MRILGTTERRLAVAFLLAAFVPFVLASSLASMAVGRAAESTANRDEVLQLEQVREDLRAYAAEERVAFTAKADAFAKRPEWSSAIERRDAAALEAVVQGLRDDAPSLLEVTATSRDGGLQARSSRASSGEESSGMVVVREIDGGTLRLVFRADPHVSAAERALRDLAEARVKRGAALLGGLDREGYRVGFAALGALTVLVGLVASTRVFRPVSRRIDEILAALKPVAEGDLSVRVGEDGPTEVAELGRAFNRMLEQLDKSRARIEFLRRVGQWQTVARRLAHEIKNPLTPIQLAVEECCQQYRGDDAAYRTLLATTHDIVTEEVASLRTLVGEFASFARLPRANLREGDLAALVRELWPRLERDLPSLEGGRLVRLVLEAPDREVPVAFDRTLFHRALVNLVSNGARATAERSGADPGHVWVRVSRLDEFGEVVIDDDGPGIPDVLRPAIFDPYVTTRKDGTGLGLSIVQKIVLDHGGTVEVVGREEGGARFVVRLPLAGTPASAAALTRSQSSAWGASGSQPGVG